MTKLSNNVRKPHAKLKRMKSDILPPLHSFTGKGVLKIEGQSEISMSFLFEQHQDGTLLLNCTVDLHTAFTNFNGASYGGHSAKRNFVGETDEKWRLEIPKLILSAQGTRDGIGYVNFLCSKATFIPPDSAQLHGKNPCFLRVPLVNFWFSPEVMDKHNFANGFQVKGQQIPLRIDGQELSLCYRRNASETMKILKERRIAGVLSDAFIPVVAPPSLCEFEEMMAVVCSLLTFTNDTRVNWLGYDMCNEEGEILRRFCIHTATSSYKGDLAGISWSPSPWITSMPLFLESAYARYQQLWDCWDIYALITLFIELRGQDNFLEVTGLHLCSCIEILNTAYKNRVGKRKFRQALREISTAIHFEVEENDLARFTDNRNSLVHEGLFNVADATVSPKTLRPRERWAWYDSKAEERDRELHFMEDFVGTLIFCALGGNKKLSGW